MHKKWKQYFASAFQLVWALLRLRLREWFYKTPFTLRTAPYDDVVIEHVDFQRSPTLRRRTVTESDTIVPIDNNGK